MSSGIIRDADQLPGGANTHSSSLITTDKELISSAETNTSPIFLASSFRTSSTWLWQKFRSAENTVAYYEIFNEILLNANRDTLLKISHLAWDSRHPTSAPYFIEFLPLIKHDGGIQSFHNTMPYDTLIPRPEFGGDLSPAEIEYVGLLLESTRRLGKQPVLSCTRMLGRAAALKAKFGGSVILLFRNLFYQWASYAGQFVSGNSFFINSIDLILKASRHDPFLAMADDLTAARTLKADDANTFQAFVLLHLYLYARAHRSADVIVDIDAIAKDTEHRTHIGKALSKFVGRPIDLSDVKQSFDYVPYLSVDKRSISDSFVQFAKMLRGFCDTPQTADFVEMIATSLVHEWDRHEFFMKGSRSIQASRMDALYERAGAAERSQHHLMAQHEALEQSAAEYRNVISQLNSERDALTSERLELTRTNQALTQTITDMDANLVELRAQIADARTASADAEALLAESNASLEAATRREAELEQTLAADRMQIAKLQSCLAAADSAFTLERTELVSMREELATELRELQDQMAADRRTAAAKESEAARLAFEEKRAAEAELEARLNAAERGRDELAAQLVETLNLKRAAKAAHISQLTETERQRDELRAALADALAQPKSIVRAAFERLKQRHTTLR